MASPRHCAGFWAEHVLRCDFMSSIPHSTLLDLPGGATLYSLLNFILSFIVFLIKPAHWPLVEWNLQDRWTLNICFFPQQRDPLAHLKNDNLSYKSNSLLLSICMHAFLFVFMFVAFAVENKSFGHLLRLYLYRHCEPECSITSRTHHRPLTMQSTTIQNAIQSNAICNFAFCFWAIQNTY